MTNVLSSPLYLAANEDAFDFSIEFGTIEYIPAMSTWDITDGFAD